jgi:hypothetical protein
MDRNCKDNNKSNCPIQSALYSSRQPLIRDNIFGHFKLGFMITIKLTSILILHSTFLVEIPDLKSKGGILKPSHSCIVNGRLQHTG